MNNLKNLILNDDRMLSKYSYFVHFWRRKSWKYELGTFLRPYSTSVLQSIHLKNGHIFMRLKKKKNAIFVLRNVGLPRERNDWRKSKRMKFAMRFQPFWSWNGQMARQQARRYHSMMMSRHFLPRCMFSYRLRIRTTCGPPDTLQWSSTSRLALGLS